MTTLTLLVGLFTFLLGFFRLGFLDAVLSRPMIRGFVLALACLIFIEQAQALLGVDKAALEPAPVGDEVYEPTPFQKLLAVIANVGLAHAPTVAISAATVVLLATARRVKRSIASLALFPEVLVCMILATALSHILEWEASGIAVLGPAQGGLLPPALPSLRPSTVRGLTTPAVLISIIGFVEAITASKHLAAHHNQSVLPNRELVALGVNNIAGSFLGAFPSFGSLSRSLVNDRAGARTQMAGFITACVVLLVCQFAMPLLRPLPQCVLAAVISVVAADLLEVEEIAFLVRVGGWGDLAMLAVTFFATVFVGVQSGTILSIAASLLLVVRETAGVAIELMGRIKVPRLEQGPGDGSPRMRYKYKYVSMPDERKARSAHGWEDATTDAPANTPTYGPSSRWWPSCGVMACCGAADVDDAPTAAAGGGGRPPMVSGRKGPERRPACTPRAPLEQRCGTRRARLPGRVAGPPEGRGWGKGWGLGGARYRWRRCCRRGSSPCSRYPGLCC